MNKKFLFAGVMSLAFSISKAQTIASMLKGHLNGSFESYNQYYMSDTSIGAILPSDRFGSNNFFKLDYNYGDFTAGMQLEAYLPPVLGFYPFPVEAQAKIVNKYFRYKKERFTIQIGDFYEQFGSGLTFRAFENRQIGINNAVEGVNVHVKPADYIQIKAIYGRTRKLFEYSKSLVRGADAELDLTKMLNSQSDDLVISVGGSAVSKYQEYTGPEESFPTKVNAYASRFDVQYRDFNIDGELVYISPNPQLVNLDSKDIGRAFLLNAGYATGNFGMNATFRSLYNLNFGNDRNEEFFTVAPINFLPALTKQHDYLTSNIYVYAAQFKGETGGQVDVFYNFPAGSALGGKYGTKISANYSNYGSLDSTNNILSVGKKNYFTDANMEIKKKWSKKWETTLGLQYIMYNTGIIRSSGSANVYANVIAFGGLYKWAPKKSVRFKLEHLNTATDDGSWASALAEISFSSPFMFFVTDLYNYGKTDIHYYNVGASYTKDATRFSLSYGKQRPGLFCAGGVCRFVPAAHGLTATLTTSFAN
jgi:hypothetical protein